MDRLSRQPAPPLLSGWLHVGSCVVTLAALACAPPAGAAPEQVTPRGRSVGVRVQATTQLGTCPPGQRAYKSGADGFVKCIAAPACAPGQGRNTAGQCACPAGSIAVRHGSDPDRPLCVPAAPCAAGQTRDATTGECRCPPGRLAYRRGNSGGATCVDMTSCPPGVKRDAATGQCQCPPGTRMYRDGTGGGSCVP